MPSTCRLKSGADTCVPIYALVPAQMLPVVDLSKSFRGRLLPSRLHNTIRRGYYKYSRIILLCAAASYCINVAVPMVKAPAGQVLAMLAVLLWLPIGFGSVTTLRYDMVRLVCQTFDFWFFSTVTSVMAVSTAMYFADLRWVRTFIDWFGYHHVICVDAHVLGLRSFTYILIASILSAAIGLAWIMLGKVDGGSSFSIVKHAIKHGSFELSGLDLIGNGLVSLGFLLAKIVFRRRKTLRKQTSTRVDCVIYRCRLKLEPVGKAEASLAWTSDDSRLGSKEDSTQAPETIQSLKFAKFSQTFDATNTLFPWKLAKRVSLSTWFLVLLYAVGALGLLLSYVVLAIEFSESRATPAHEEFMFAVASGALLSTMVFVGSFAAFYQRQLLQLLFSSFDFAFYSFQITSANICVWALYIWDPAHGLVTLSWWLWAHWVFTLDALTPVMRGILKIRIRFVALVLCLLLTDHIALVYRIFCVEDTELEDSVIFQGTVWGKYLVVRVIPIYVSRSVTMLLWCSRLVVRLASSSSDDVSIIRGSVYYDNPFTRGRRNSVQITNLVKAKQ